MGSAQQGFVLKKESVLPGPVSSSHHRCLNIMCQWGPKAHHRKIQISELAGFAHFSLSCASLAVI